MIGRVLRVARWLGLNSLVFSGLYWLFLNTPESNVWMLAASGVLLVTMVVGVGVAVNTATLLARGVALSSAVSRATRGIHWFVVAALPVVAAWWLTTRADDWVTKHAGEINARFIAQFGWADVSWFFASVSWLIGWFRWVLVPMASLAMLAAVLEHGRTSRGWLHRAWHWRTLALATLAFAVLFVLPWRLTTWRPDLPPTWVEPVVAGLRLAVVAALVMIGCAVMVALAVGVSSIAKDASNRQR